MSKNHVITTYKQGYCKKRNFLKCCGDSCYNGRNGRFICYPCDSMDNLFFVGSKFKFKKNNF